MRSCLALPLLLLAAPVAADPAQDRATAAFGAMYAEACVMAFAPDGSLIEPPVRHAVQMPVTWSDPVPVTVWEFFCLMGAYNRQTVFLLQSDQAGLVPLTLARPALDIVTEDPEDPDSPLREVKIAGWEASPFAVNVVFDPATGVLEENSLWRGLGDASHLGRWRLVDDMLRLTQFDVDASYDGQENRVPLVHLP